MPTVTKIVTANGVSRREVRRVNTKQEAQRLVDSEGYRFSTSSVWRKRRNARTGKPNRPAIIRVPHPDSDEAKQYLEAKPEGERSGFLKRLMDLYKSVAAPNGKRRR